MGDGPEALASDRLLSLTAPYLHVLVCDAVDTELLVSRLAGDGVVARRVRGRKMRTEQGVFDEVAAVLQFRQYFGENWDAFRDCLRDIEPHHAPWVVVVEDAHLLLAGGSDRELRIFTEIMAEAGFERASSLTDFPLSRHPLTPFHTVLQVPGKEEREALGRRLAALEIDALSIPTPTIDVPPESIYVSTGPDPTYYDRALELDRQDRPLEAAAVYEAALAFGGRTFDCYRRLIALYCELHDGGALAHYQIGESFELFGVNRYFGLLREALWQYPDHPEFVFWKHYLPWRYWGEKELRTLAPSLLATGRTKAPLVVLFERFPEQAETYLAELRSGPMTISEQTFKSVLESWILSRDW